MGDRYVGLWEPSKKTKASTRREAARREVIVDVVNCNQSKDRRKGIHINSAG
jgi:hypothetical protein